MNGTILVEGKERSVAEFLKALLHQHQEAVKMWDEINQYEAEVAEAEADSN